MSYDTEQALARLATDDEVANRVRTDFLEDDAFEVQPSSARAITNGEPLLEAADRHGLARRLALAGGPVGMGYG